MKRSNKHLLQVNGRCAVYLFILCSFLFCSFSLQAAPVIIIHDTDQSTIQLNRFVDILDDPDHSYQAEQLFRQPLAMQFSPVDINHRQQMELYSDHFWLRFSISNAGSEPLELWLQGKDSALSELQAFARTDSGQSRELPSALLEDSLLSPILKAVTIPPQATHIYLLKVSTPHRHGYQLQLSSPADFHFSTLMTSTLFSASLGTMILMVIFCIIIAVYRSSLIFLHHGHYIASLFAVQVIGLGLIRGWFPNATAWQHGAIICFFYLSNASVLHVTQHYLKANGCYDGFRSTIHFMLNINFLIYLGLLIWLDSYSPLIWIPVVLAAPVVLSAYYYCYRKTRQPLSLWICWSRIAGICAYIAVLLINFDSFDIYQVIDPGLLLCLLLEAFVTGMLLLAHEFELFSRERSQQQLLQINETRQQAQNQVLSELSHDLRSPISGILGMADLLRSSSLSPSQQDQLEAIRSSGQTLLNKVSELHQRLQLQQGELADRKAPFELALLIEECVNSFQMQAEERNLELILSIQPDVPVIVEGNAIYLRQILMQLISNAVKYTAQGDVIIRVSRQASQPRQIHFAIRDTGRGISKPHLAQLQQSQSRDMNAEQASGLPVVKTLLQQLHTSLSINSTLGEGSEFSFDMVLPEAHTDSHTLAEQQQLLQGKSLLIVDDNHTCCKVLKQQAGSWGMQASEAYDGNEALALFRARKNLNEPFDAIIVDYDMPHLSGVEVAEKIVEESDEPPVIIMLTGLNLTPPESITRQAGIEVVLNKPASQKLIRLTLNNLFHLHQKQQQAQQVEASEAKLKVLIAEDNDVSRRVISKMMERLNVHCKLASDGQLALDAIKRERFDMILMDCEMPIMDGFEATQQIHDWQASRHQKPTPIIALTAHVLGEHKARSQAAGMVDYLEKPVQMAELETLLKKWTESPAGDSSTEL